jgi:hypothetical protein
LRLDLFEEKHMTDTVVAIGSTKEGELLAYAANRPPCPFYGFVGMVEMFVDNKGNACGLAGGHHPCAMEMVSEKPNWKECKRFNHEKNLENIANALDHCKIFPDELRPPNASEWDGVSLRGWYQLIMRE